MPFIQKSVIIDPGESQLISLTGNCSTADEDGHAHNNVELILESRNNHNLKKIYNFTVFTTLDDLSNDIISNSYNLINVYPNPFNPSAVINIKIDEMINNADINIYDLNGKLIENIYSGSFNPGDYDFIWSPQSLASGKYFISLESRKATTVKELIYIK